MPSRARQRRAAREIASEIDIDRRGVGTVDRIGGMDVFLRSPGVEQFGDRVRDQFASEADFVEAGDVDPNVDAQDIRAEPQIAQSRRSSVADRARRQTAAEAEFIERDDLRAEVGAFGVTDLGVRDSRRDDIQQRAATALAADDPFAEPGDFSVDVSDRGIESAGLSDTGQRRRAGRFFESETPLRSVDPTRDVSPADDGFELTSGAQRRLSARQFEREFDLFGTGELDPERDIRQVEGGFALGEEPAAEIAAADLDAQYSDIDITPDDISLEPTDGGGFEAVFEREVRR